MANEEQAIQVARILARCPKSRLELVMKVLANAGIDTDIDVDEVLKAAGTNDEARARARQTRMENRNGGVEGKEMSEIYAARLRKAYEAGVCITTLSQLADVNRVSIYHYLRGTRMVPQKYGDRLLEALNELGY